MERRPNKRKIGSDYGKLMLFLLSFRGPSAAISDGRTRAADDIVECRGDCRS